MADKEKKSDSQQPSQSKGESSGAFKRIDESQRFRYIGFEVFPGKPKDLFKSDAERQKWVERLQARRQKGESSREHNTLLEERVSFGERIVLALACLVVIGSLFLPWYSAYTETTVETKPTAEAAPTSAPPPAASELVDSLEGVIDSVALAQTGAGDSAAAATQSDATQSPIGGEEVIHSAVARKKVVKEVSSLNWFGSLAALGSIGGYVFSSGLLAISGVLMLLYQLMAIALPLFTLYLLFGSKERGDQLALKLKRTLKLNWVPVILFVLVFVLSFFGAQYSFDAPSMFDSLGTSYGIGALANALSWGVFVSLAMFVMVAAKSIEI
ncbi:MAG: hypothetical protein RBT76_04690 [candidate division Zixibacteria bacterium]|jgi:hypothetical protein|nr:hypothetical protein [candidate division Zixibacteria bacterium]